MNSKIKVLVNGAAGKMGKEVVKAILKENDLELSGAVDILGNLQDLNIPVTKNLLDAIKKSNPDVMVDFTIPKSVMASIKIALENKVNVVVGTTGITSENLDEIRDLCKKYNVNALVAPNFAIGAVLMMKFSCEAAKYMPKAEIIELHHDQKLDAPSGTSIKTAEMMKKSSNLKDIPIHSVRLPGFVAHQEVIFGGIGQTLTIRHDSISRESFMPGVILAIRKIKEIQGLVYGLENIL